MNTDITYCQGLDEPICSLCHRRNHPATTEPIWWALPQVVNNDCPNFLK